MYRIIALVSVVLIVVCVASRVPAVSADGTSPRALPLGEQGVVAAIVDGDTLVLESGTEVRLVGIQAPKIPLGRAGFVAWPLGEEARAALTGFALGRVVALHYGGRQMDRHGRALAHIVRDDGLWVQAMMLEAGFARVYSFPDNRALVADMLNHEAVARRAGRGIWADDFYRPQSPESAADLLNTFQLVEGRVLSAAIVRGRAYLNFGTDWRSDFTATVSPRDRRVFDAEEYDLKGLEGRTVRVRGWIKSFNGPMIGVTHPEQIEVFD